MHGSGHITSEAQGGSQAVQLAAGKRNDKAAVVRQTFVRTIRHWDKGLRQQIDRLRTASAALSQWLLTVVLGHNLFLPLQLNRRMDLHVCRRARRCFHGRVRHLRHDERHALHRRPVGLDTVRTEKGDLVE